MGYEKVMKNNLKNIQMLIMIIGFVRVLFEYD